MLIPLGSSKAVNEWRGLKRKDLNGEGCVVFSHFLIEVFVAVFLNYRCCQTVCGDSQSWEVFTSH